MTPIALQKREFIDLFSALECSTALGRKQRSSADIVKMQEIGRKCWVDEVLGDII